MSKSYKKESLQWNLKGKTFDARQVSNKKGEWLDNLEKDIDPMGWIISYGPNVSNPGQTLMGTVPLMLVGHEDIEQSKVNDIIDWLESRKLKTSTSPAINPSESAPVDLRKFVMNGRYSTEFQRMFPKSYQQLTDAVQVTYDTANFPQLNGILTTFLEENSPMTLKNLENWLKEAASRFKNPENHKRNMGNVDHMFWDYFKKTSFNSDDRDEDMKGLDDFDTDDTSQF